MPQARLPDVNTAFIKWRNKAVISLESEKYTACIGALNGFNACLPDKYRVRVSTDEYMLKLAQEKLLVTCSHCATQTDFREVKKSMIVTTPIIELITGLKQQKVWTCAKCKKDNEITQSEFIKTKLPDPYYLGVVPNPPTRKDGIMDRTTYHRKMEAWVWTFIGELEEKASEFREDNWQKSENMAEIEIPDEGDE